MFDVVVIGGGPCGSTAANYLASLGHKTALLDRAGRIKPCGGAIPPRAIEDFEIPDELLKAKVTTARMVSPTNRSVDIPIENGYVGMVDREEFDEFLRERAAKKGAKRYTGTFEKITRDSAGATVHFRNHVNRTVEQLKTRYVIGADGARSNVAKAEIPDSDKIPYVIAYHEIIEAPETTGKYDPKRCDVIYDGTISPDFYGWVFPHGKSASVGMGTGHHGFDLKTATSELRSRAGLDKCKTIRKEGAPIPLKPLKRWDNGSDVLVAGDAAGVVAPSSGEGIYYAMAAGQIAAETMVETIVSNSPANLKLARQRFLKEHGTVFNVLGAMQNAYYKSDNRRERFVSLCHDVDVQTLTFEAYMNKKLVSARPLAHLKIMFKNLAHLTGIVSKEFT